MQNERSFRKHSYEKGKVFGRLMLTGVSHLKEMYGQQRRIVEAECDCGTIRGYLFGLLITGETRSCGCLQRELSRERFTTHGLTNHPLYEVWQAMRKRCYVPNTKQFDDYGGRGIDVCDAWVDDFVCFYEWAVVNGYQSGLSLERKDNDKGYSPENCYWATRAQQNRNTRRNRNFTAFGETKCLFDWGKDPRCAVGIWGLRSRIDKSKKWEGRFEEALTTPIDMKRDLRKKKNNVYVTAFGETKCLAEWVEDKRCVVAMDRLRDRIAEGWEHLAAITTVHKDKKDVDLTAFGETKTMANWLRDERCVVKVDALRDRFRAGWKHEDCISIPSRTGTKKNFKVSK